MGAKDICNALFWLIILLFISWWVAAISFPFYIVLSVLASCLGSLKSLSDFFLHGVQFPAKCSANLVKMNAYDSF